MRATVALARLVKQRQPRLWDFALGLRSKDAVKREFGLAQAAGRPLLHVSGMYGTDRGCLALVWPLSPHPTNRNEVIVWDLAHDPAELLGLDAATLRRRMFEKAEALPAGTARLPIKTVHLNRSPIVVANPRTLSPEAAARWGIDLDLARRHAEVAARCAPQLAGVWPEVYRRPQDEEGARAAPVDVDEDLYGGFLDDPDRRALQRLRSLAPERLAASRPAFDDPRLDELVFRYRARNFPETLDDAGRARWEALRAARLHDGAGGALTLEAFFERVDALGESADERGQDILGALVDYATAIAPERR